ncbi:alternative sulfate transporter [Emericellopsis atlantica]|uniref:Alternative sulfate transporter n=1 Tax=Emericellopsis atlantica TaxID=2614577 RepID=A0A9P7ZNA9_9HYPO|nr:alternative sulfate transporter [Emericellopsis atlantica]KAG9254867.1 alternative sulfate transporter [Emericellopsis atlantica]
MTGAPPNGPQDAADKQDGTVMCNVHDEPASVAHIDYQEVEWTASEESKLVRKLDCVVMPLLAAGFFVLQLDRGNIGNAVTDFFFADVGITQFEFNVGNQLMYLGVTLFEIPSNLVLYRIGPAAWIGCQVLAWGMVATFQAFIKGKGAGAYMATRFLLGACESGYIPAGLFTIARFYTTSETSKRFGWFFFGNMLANACGGLIAYGILHMRGIAGLAGWQWMFIIEGLLTVVVAALFLVLFPRSSQRPISLLGISLFNEREARILTARVMRDDHTKIQAKQHVSRDEFKSAMTNWRSLGHIIVAICCLSSQTSLFTYAPSIVASYNYGRLQSNALVSVGYWILILTTLSWGYIADKWDRRGPMVLLGVTIGWILVVANRSIIDTGSNSAKYAVLVLIIGTSFNWHPVNGSWMSLNARSAGERSVSMAIFVMSANCAGIVASQIFQAEDAPQYRTAWTVVLSLSSVGLVACCLTNLQYWLLNRRNRKTGVDTFVYKP